MRVRIQVVVEPESDTIPVVHEVATLERDGLQPEGLGLTLAEAKDLLRGVQETMVAEQVAAFEAQQECCPDCGRTRRRNGRYASDHERRHEPEARADVFPLAGQPQSHRILPRGVVP